MPQDDQITRGMRFAAERPQVMPGEADQRIQPVYEDVYRTLRVPFMNLIFRTLAGDPDYLVPAWQQLVPVLRTRAFERAADQLRAHALLAPAPSSAGVQWERTGPLDKIRAFNDTIHYVLPKLLLIATAWELEEWGGGAAGEGDTDQIPLGVAAGTDKGPLVSLDEAPERVRRILEREQQAHGHPLVSSYYRIMANWPDFLEAAWSRVEPLVGTEPYEARKEALARTAVRLVGELPLAGHLGEARRTPEISALLYAFRLEFIPSMMLDVALVKAMLDGEEEARRSRFSVA